MEFHQIITAKLLELLEFLGVTIGSIESRFREENQLTNPLESVFEV